MRSHRDAVQRAVILILTMVDALFHSAADAVVRFAMIHDTTLLYSIFLFSPFINKRTGEGRRLQMQPFLPPVVSIPARPSLTHLLRLVKIAGICYR